MEKKKKKSPRGRKLFDGKDIKTVVAKLEEAWSLGCSDGEACFYADISRQALMNYQRGNEEFLYRKERFKEETIFLARKEVVKGIQGNHEFALKYLERKRKKEFGTSSNLVLQGDEDNPIVNKVLVDWNDEPKNKDGKPKAKRASKTK